MISAAEKEVENKLWEYWKLQFPNMDKETYISFEDYKAKMTANKQHSEISYNDIENEMNAVVKAYERR